MSIENRNKKDLRSLIKFIDFILLSVLLFCISNFYFYSKNYFIKHGDNLQ